MNYYVFFSGGHDSTSILLKYGENSSEINPINVIQCNHSYLCKLQNEKQKDVCEKIIDLLSKKGYFYNVINMSFYSDKHMAISGGFQQLSWWLGFALPYIKDNSSICIGLTRDSGDNWQAEPYMKEILSSWKKLQNRNNISLNFPLRWMTKVDILNFIENKEPKLLNLIWTCENPIKRKDNKIVACGKCNKCMELNVAKYRKDLVTKSKLHKLNEEPRR